MQLINIFACHLQFAFPEHHLIFQHLCPLLCLLIINPLLVYLLLQCVVLLSPLLAQHHRFPQLPLHLFELLLYLANFCLFYGPKLSLFLFPLAIVTNIARIVVACFL